MFYLSSNLLSTNVNDKLASYTHSLLIILSSHWQALLDISEELAMQVVMDDVQAGTPCQRELTKCVYNVILMQYDSRVLSRNFCLGGKLRKTPQEILD